LPRSVSHSSLNLADFFRYLGSHFIGVVLVVVGRVLFQTATEVQDLELEGQPLLEHHQETHLEETDDPRAQPDEDHHDRLLSKLVKARPRSRDLLAHVVDEPSHHEAEDRHGSPEEEGADHSNNE